MRGYDSLIGRLRDAGFGHLGKDHFRAAGKASYALTIPDRGALMRCLNAIAQG